ncbi:MAG: PTS sugar transporter subunit IIA [Coprobacillaceae bacterium]
MKKNKEIVIATHGELAEGLVSALQIIVGELSNVKTICGYIDADFDLEQAIEKLMIEHDFENKDLVVCTDMMGGSINNGFVKYLGRYPFHLITNINLAFLVDLLLSQVEISGTMLDQKVQEDLVTVKYVNKLLNTFNDEDSL